MSVIPFPTHAHSKSVAKAVEQYILCEPDDVMASTTDGVGFVRVMVPFCEHTDQELADLIARCAVMHGRNLAFDLPPQADTPAVAGGTSASR